MLKAVVDTNVIISGTILSCGNPFEVLEAWRRRKFALLISREIIAEVEAVLRRPKLFQKYRLTEDQLAGLFASFDEEAMVVPPVPIDPPAGIESADLKFLACAESGSADYLVTGDQALLDLKTYKRTRIVTPRTFLTILKAARRSSGER